MQERLASRESIEEFFFRIKTEIRRMYEKVTGCWAYLKFIWTNDAYREWDFEYLYDIILFKLNRMAIQLEKDTFVAGSDKTVAQIRKAIDLYQHYTTIEDEMYNNSFAKDRNDKKFYMKISEMKQSLWVRFHDLLKDEAQGWWS